MGQYFYVMNLDKKEFLHPHHFNDGLKLLEFGLSGCGIMSALAILLRQSSEGGGGDMNRDSPLIGSWAGDRIAIVGDYDESGLFTKADEGACGWTNISQKVLLVLLDDSYVANIFKGYLKEDWSLFKSNASQEVLNKLKGDKK